MRNLWAFFGKYNHWLVFLLLEAVSMVLLFSYNSYQGSVWLTSANAVAGKVYEWESMLTSYVSLKTVNAELTRRNLMLEREVQTLNDQILNTQADSLNTVSAVRTALSGYKLIDAKVISNSTTRPDNLITIDKGAADGVKKDMGVACGTGVVGIVFLVSDHYSVVIPVTNVNSHISCMIRKRGYFGTLRWKEGDVESAYVDDIPRHARFALYDNVVTSGYSSIFPSGISVGKIMHVYNSADGLSYTLKLRLSTNFSTLRDVCVIDNTALGERLELMRAANDSIRNNKDTRR